MKRDRHEFEMSLHLDGRLPSGRRQRLQRRLAEDFEAARTWDELRRCQQAALELPGQSVSPTFTATLHERIASGEGTPEAVFRTPVPVRTRVRYALAGAAAALVVLIAQHVVRGRTATEESPPIASAALGLDTEVRRLDAADLPAIATASPALEPLNAWNTVRRGQQLCVDSVSELKRRLVRVEPRLDVVVPSEVVGSLEPIVENVRSSTALMNWLAEEQIIELPGGFVATLELTRNNLQRLERAQGQNDAIALRTVVEDLKRLPIDPLTARIRVNCCSPEDDFRARVYHRMVSDPSLLRALGVIVARLGHAGAVEPLDLRLSPLPALEPAAGRVMLLMFRDQHGRGFVLLQLERSQKGPR